MQAIIIFRQFLHLTLQNFLILIIVLDFSRQPEIVLGICRHPVRPLKKLMLSWICHDLCNLQ